MVDFSLENIKKYALMLCIGAIFPFLVAKGFDLVQNSLGQKDKQYRRNYFYTTMVSGAIAVVAGIAIKMNFVGAGFIVGGLLSMLSGLVQSWSDLNTMMQFVVLLLIFLLLLVGSYFLVVRSKKK